MRRRKRNYGEESYWKTSTDIMAGVLLVILLILMLLLLYITQLNNGETTYSPFYDKVTSNDSEYDVQPTTIHDNVASGNYNKPEKDSSGGGGGGEDDPGKDNPDVGKKDEGHDKTAVYVTVVDEETGNVIKKDGILFELYADKNAVGGLQVLHTYYPDVVEYKQYQTTKNGTFYLPEKISLGWYSFHNLVAPEGYSLADNFDFEVNESLDWPNPFLVKIPMSPSKNRIYVRCVDADTNQKVTGQTYDIFAAEDIVTLDGTVRYKSGQKVGKIVCDANGFGASEKLYLGKYYLSQTTTAPYYARFMSRVDTEVKLTNTEKDAVMIKCNKTKADIILTDEYSEDPIKGAVYTVTDKGDVTTDDKGRLLISDLDKNKTYSVKLKSVPEPYNISSDMLEFTVDKDGLINGESHPAFEQTAYMTRLSVDIKDIVFKNSVAGTDLTLYDGNDKVADMWNSFGEARIVEGLKPGAYYLEIGDNSSDRIKIDVKDTADLQKSENYIWTLWDTIMVIASAVLFAIVVFIILRIIRSRRKKKANEQKDNVEEK